MIQRSFMVGLAGVLSITAAASAELVVNGGFEVPELSSLFVPVSAGDPFITGWTVTSGQVDLVEISVANDGDQLVDLAGTPGRGTIEQLLTTVPGQEYVLSFALSSNGAPKPNGVTVFWAGGEVATLSSPAQGSWTQHQFFVTATDASTALTFQGNIDGFVGTFVDSVSVVVPEPTSLTSLAILGVCLLKGRRRAGR